MIQIKWTHSARSDLLEIIDYLASHDFQSAEKFLAHLEKMENNLSLFPGIGLSLETALPINQVLVKPVRLLYLEDKNGITVIACLHQSRDWRALLASRNLR